MPTLEEALTTLSGRVGVDIELKQLPGEPDFDPDVDRLVEATLRAIDAVAFVGPVLLTSFNPFAIDAARRLAPGRPGRAADRPVGGGGRRPGVRRVSRRTTGCCRPSHGSSRRGSGWSRAPTTPGCGSGTWNTEDPDEARTLMRLGARRDRHERPGRDRRRPRRVGRLMFRRRRLPPELEPVRDAFDAVLAEVEPAKAALADCMPTTRLPGRPLPDALAEYEEHLERARALMPALASPGARDGVARLRRGVGRCARARTPAP